MPRVSHLLRRNGIYWFKIDLPDDLAGQPLPPSIPQTIKQLESPMRAGRLETAVWLSLRTSAKPSSVSAFRSHNMQACSTRRGRS